MPWWIIVALSLFGGASRTREALPYATPEEREVLRLLDAAKKRRLTLANIEHLKRKIDAMQISLRNRQAQLTPRHAAVQKRIAALQASGAKPTPDLIEEIRSISHDTDAFAQEADRYLVYMQTYEGMLRGIEGSCAYG